MHLGGRAYVILELLRFCGPARALSSRGWDASDRRRRVLSTVAQQPVLTEYFVLEYPLLRNIVYWNVPTNGVFYTPYGLNVLYWNIPSG